MIDYLLKFLLASLLLYGIYHLVLRDETTFRFNRFYLLAILLIAAVIPITVTSVEVVPVVNQLPAEAAVVNGPLTITPLQVTEGTAEKIMLWQVLLLIFAPVSLYLIFRYLRNLFIISRLGKGAKKVNHNGLKLMLRHDITETFSFMGRVYANQAQFEANQLPDAILEHERAHINQKHSYDLLFIELLNCFLWFNPVIYLIKRSIRLNHEYLADRHVVEQIGTTSRYQNLLIEFASQQHLLKLPLVSQLTFGETKKRIIIMAKQTSVGLRAFKKVCVFIMTAGLFLWLGDEQVIAQQVSQEQENQNQQVQDDRPPPPPPFVVELVASSRVKFTDQNGDEVTKVFGDLSADEKAYFISLGDKAFIQIPPPPRALISAEMMEDFKDDGKYKVWIDGKQVDNAALNRYEGDDFHHFFKTPVHKTSPDYGKVDYKLDIKTMAAMERFMNGHFIAMHKEFIPPPPPPTSDNSDNND